MASLLRPLLPQESPRSEMPTLHEPNTFDGTDFASLQPDHSSSGLSPSPGKDSSEM
jgi:hypothetical protein